MKISLSSLRWRETQLASALFCLLCLFALFHNLGGAALFEPDEGRNAEIAREILLLKDWGTPHYNFIPRLDKPIFFYALTALCYKLFGVSEMAARLPSAITALGAILLTYLLARSLHGSWAALWSSLILATCVEYYAFSRIVILDMTLGFFITLSLTAFYWGSAAETKGRKRGSYLLMYVALGGATLVKGPIGFVLPGMIIFAYLLIKKKWAILAEMELVWGALIFVLIVAPWYAWAEMRNPGYLAYFLGEENFIRFLTPHFRRTKSWYYFAAALAVGFLPWTPLIPAVVRRLWKRSLDDSSLYLVLWTVVPVLFFSLSHSKMAEYILPIYPALSILTGRAVADILKDSSARGVWVLSLCWHVVSLSLLYLLLGWVWPEALPVEIRNGIAQLFQMTGAFATGIILAFIVLPLTAWMTFRRDQQRLFLLSCLVFFLLFFFLHRFVESLSLNRSYKEMARKSAPLLRPGDQLVVYDTYLAGLPFYLNVNQPIWIVSSEDKSNIMGSVYVAKRRPPPAPGYSKALFTFEEFFKEWEGSQRRLLVFIKERRLRELSAPKILLQVGEVALVTNQ